MTDLLPTSSEIQAHADEAYRQAIVKAQVEGLPMAEVLRLGDAAYDAVIDAAYGELEAA